MKLKFHHTCAALAGSIALVLRLHAEELPVTQLDTITVTGRGESLVGTATSSNEGVVGAEQLARRPLQRVGEIVETIPGVIVSQHAGGGKANQFYLRGFNLDHGTDLATSLDGMPINLPTHAHGQGYTDLNLLIPELVREVEYKKGPYFAEIGDFGSAGAFNIHYFDTLPNQLAVATGGSLGYARGLLAGSPQVGTGHLLYAAEYEHSDGPWDRPDDFNKGNAVLRYSVGDDQNGFSLMLTAYHGSWNSSDQLARRAIGRQVDRWGSLDGTTGGDSSRVNLMADWHRADAASATHVLLYGFYYDLDLFSDFTYFLDDPVHGDQFEQVDKRLTLGLKASQTWFGELFGKKTDNTLGLQVRSDNIRNGLYKTQNTSRLSTTRADHVIETSVGAYYENKTQWAEKIRTVAGVRGDVFNFDVRTSSLEVNTGDKTSFIASPKASLIFGPWAQTEFYLNGGFGFHSNDARGVLTRVDPGTGESVQTAKPLVRTKGAEVGVRTTALPGLQSSLTFWMLDIDSELLFVGDAGTTEASRPSRRYGVEFANFYDVNKWLTLDADFAWSHTRFRDEAPEGDHIPGSLETVVAAGISVHDIWGGLFGSVRVRYFGPRSLIEDDSVRSPSTTIVNAQVGYKFNETWTATVDLLNLLDERSSDIDYFYTSRLRGEPEEGADDIHTHPNEPLSVRFTVSARF
jgi:outer membrane receptor protein involved in Fe transport